MDFRKLLLLVFGVKVRRVIFLTLYGFFCMALGTFVLGLVDEFSKRNLPRVHLDTENYEVDVIFKSPQMLIINNIRQVERRVQGGMEDMMIDLMAPLPFQDVFSRINYEKLEEKRKFVEGFKKFLDEQKKFEESKT